MGTTCSFAPSSGSSCPLPPEHFLRGPSALRRTFGGALRLTALPVSLRVETCGVLGGGGWSEAGRRGLELRTEVQSRGWPRGDLGGGGRASAGRPAVGGGKLVLAPGAAVRPDVLAEWPEASLQHPSWPSLRDRDSARQGKARQSLPCALRLAGSLIAIPGLTGGRSTLGIYFELGGYGGWMVG